MAYDHDVQLYAEFDEAAWQKQYVKQRAAWGWPEDGVSDVRGLTENRQPLSRQ
jgi:hypothetical protein